MLNNEAEIIALAFGEISKTLEMKKQQLTEDLENQRRKKEKEFQIWKKMKETHKKTIENLLNDCEKLVHECDPQQFLEVMIFFFLFFFSLDISGIAEFKSCVALDMLHSGIKIGSGKANLASDKNYLTLCFFIRVLFILETFDKLSLKIISDT